MQLYYPYVVSWLSLIVYFFFFKQKTAYEMRISDWSSDVCSSDLPARRDELRFIAGHLERGTALARLLKIFRRLQADQLLLRDLMAEAAAADDLPDAGLSEDARLELALLHALRVALIPRFRSEEHTSDIQSLKSNSFVCLCLKKK